MVSSIMIFSRSRYHTWARMHTGFAERKTRIARIDREREWPRKNVENTKILPRIARMTRISQKTTKETKAAGERPNDEWRRPKSGVEQESTEITEGMAAKERRGRRDEE